VELRLAAQPLVQFGYSSAAGRLGAVQTLAPRSRLGIEWTSWCPRGRDGAGRPR
jgi:hypothetical protein